MKLVVQKILFAFAVIGAVVIWYSYSINFAAVDSTKDKVTSKAESVVAQSPQGAAQALPPPPDLPAQPLPPPPKATSPTTVVDFLRTPYCRSQHDDFIKRKTHSEIVKARKADPQIYDMKCFLVNESVDQKTLEKCLTGTSQTAAASESMQAVMCQAFLKVYQTYVIDFLYPDDVDVKTLSQNVLQKKIQAQILKQQKNPQLMLALTRTLIELHPNDFESLKIYIKALGFGQKPEVYAEGGPLFSHLVKAYGLNPRDIEIREMYMYGLIHSPDGEAKLLKVFPNVKEDGKLQALRYYYLAWAGWNKADRTQALNNLEFAKSLSNNDPRFSEAYDKVKDPVNVPKTEGLFYLSFSLL